MTADDARVRREHRASQMWEHHRRNGNRRRMRKWATTLIRLRYPEGFSHARR